MATSHRQRVIRSDGRAVSVLANVANLAFDGKSVWFHSVNSSEFSSIRINLEGSVDDDSRSSQNNSLLNHAVGLERCLQH